MPAKRKDVLIGKQFQDRVILTRLTQISLLVDGYIYQQKPMSQRSLTAYIRELSSYKEKCYQDVNSLQVIEKLIVCMNGIILEQQELNGEGIGDEFVFANQVIADDNNELMLSPVYSTADEDLTQISSEINDDLVPIVEPMQDKRTDSNKNVFAFQEMPKDNNNEPMLPPAYSTADEHLTQIMSSEKNDDLGPMEQMQDKRTDPNENQDGIETRDVTTQKVLPNIALQAPNTEYPMNMEVIDDDYIDQIISQNNALNINNEPELNIQNAISNLSTIDFKETFTQFSQDCSQSILDSCIPTYWCNTANSVTKDVAVPLTQNVTRVTIAHQEPVTKIVTHNKIANLLPTTKRKLNVHAPVANRTLVIQNTQVMQTTSKDTLKTKASEKKPKKRNVRNKNNTKLPSKTVATNISKAITKVKVAEIKQSVKASETKPSHEAVNTTHANETQKVHSDNPYQAYNTKPSLTDSKTPTLIPITDEITGKDILPIYKHKVTNDLSWIKNIRFVREISSEEYEPFTGDDDFWKNCFLPYENEDDFNY